MRILLLTPSLPYPPIWGFGTRVYQFLRLLARRHRVSLLTFQEPGEADKVAALAKVCGSVHTVPRAAETASHKRFAQLSSMFSPVSYQRRNLHSRAMQEALDNLTAQEHFDVIQIESSQLASYTFDSSTPIVLDEHNIEYELLYRMHQTERSSMRRLYNWVEFNKFKREEIDTWRRVSGCLCTSTREEQIMRAIVPQTQFLVAPNAVDVDYFRPSGEPIDENALVMTGLMHYRPNIDGAQYFVREIFPYILASRPKSVFYIVGAGATNEVKQLAGSNVVVTDTVPDVRPYLDRCAVFVVPLRMGGGTRLKVVEGLSMGKAVVSTSVGCEGIGVTNGEHLQIADEPKGFADAVLKVLENSDMAIKFGQHGRALVERHYRWETVVERIEEFYDRLVVESSGSARDQGPWPTD